MQIKPGTFYYLQCPIVEKMGFSLKIIPVPGFAFGHLKGLQKVIF
jgi:hypothetical protein